MKHFIKDIKVLSADLFTAAIRELEQETSKLQILPKHLDNKILFIIKQKAKDPTEVTIGQEIWTFGINVYPVSQFIKRSISNDNDIVFMDSIQLLHLDHPASRINDLITEREYYSQADEKIAEEIDNELLMCYIPPDKEYVYKMLDINIKPQILNKCRNLLEKADKDKKNIDQKAIA